MTSSRSRLQRIKTSVLGRGTAAVTLQTLSASILLIGLSMATSILTARALGPDGRGVLAAILLWPPLLATFATLGLQTSFVYHAKRNASSTSDYFGWALAISATFSIVPSIAGWFLIPHLLNDYGAETISFARSYVLIATPLAVALLFLTTVTQFIDDFRLFNLSRIIQPLLQFVGLVVLAFIHHITPLNVAITFLITSVLTIVIVAPYLFRRIKPTFNGSAGLKGLLIYGLSVYGVDVLGALSTQIDKVFIAASLTARELGLYTVAYALSRVISQLQNASATVIFPRTAGLDKHAVIERVGRAFRLSTWLTLVSALPFFLLSYLLIEILYGREFRSAGIAFQILLLESVIASASWVLAQAFNSLGRPQLIVFRQAVGLGATVILLWLLAPRYGIYGIALAMLAGSVFRLLITLVAFPSSLRHPIPRIWLTRADLRYLYQKIATGLGH